MLEVEEVVNWFLSNYEDPAENCLYQSREGGYQYIYGGLYSAEEELNNKQGDAIPPILDKVLAEINDDDVINWSGTPD